MSRRTSLAAVVLLVAVVLIGLARRGSHHEPERVLPPVAERSPAARKSEVTESRVDPSERAAIVEPATRAVPVLAVSGTVRDAKSKLAGAMVSLWLEEHSPAPLAKMVTGADGAFSFPVETDRPYLLACTAPEHDEGGGEARPGKPVELYLASREATIELYGHVQTPDSKPVTSFTINVSSVRGNKVQSVFNSKPLQSPTGDFRIQVGTRIQSSTLSVTASAPGFDSGSKQVKDVRERTSTDVGAIELQPLHIAIEGIVEDAQTKLPIAGAHIEGLCDPPGQQRDVESGADGTFQVSVLPRQVLSGVSVRADGYAPRVIELHRIDGRLQVELSAGATIHGMVECVGAARSSETRVVWWGRHGRNDGPSEPTQLGGVATINPNGEFELTHVAASPLYVALYHEVRDGGQRVIYRSQVQELWPSEGQRKEVEFRVGASPAIRMHLLPNTKGLVVGRLLDASGSLVSVTDTLSGGDLIFLDVPQGHYEIRVCKTDAEHYLARSVDVGRDDLFLDDWDITAMPRR